MATALFVLCLFEWIHRDENKTYKAIFFGGLGLFIAVPMNTLEMRETPLRWCIVSLWGCVLEYHIYLDFMSIQYSNFFSYLGVHSDKSLVSMIYVVTVIKSGIFSS
jgi:hypothetical protein